jgi:DNA processing protein
MPPTVPRDPAADPAVLAAWVADPANACLDRDDPRYPPWLRELPGAPPVLYVRGNVGCLGLPQLAIVGSRNATPDGRDNAARFAGFLAARGFCITSGLAEGVDAAAHEAALAAGGRTIAVCGTGLDRVYPRQHAGLATRASACNGITSRGATASSVACRSARSSSRRASRAAR